MPGANKSLREKEGFFRRAFKGSVALSISWFQISGLQNHENKFLLTFVTICYSSHKKLIQGTRSSPVPKSTDGSLTCKQTKAFPLLLDLNWTHYLNQLEIACDIGAKKLILLRFLIWEKVSSITRCITDIFIHLYFIICSPI